MEKMKSSIDFDLFIEKKSGARQSSDLKPTVRLLTTNNRFQISKLGTQMLGVKVKDSIKFWENPNATSINDKFFIAQVPEGTPGASTLTKSNSANAAVEDVDMCFNYSGIWGNILQGFEGKDASAEALVESGLVIKSITKKGAVAYRATKNVIFTLKPVGEAVIKGITYNMFALIDFTEVEANLQTIENTDPEDSDDATEDTDSDVTDLDFETPID